MFFAIIIVPVVAYFAVGGSGAIDVAMTQKNISINLLKYPEALSIPVIISGLG